MLSAWSAKAAAAPIAAVACMVVLGWAVLSRDRDQVLIWFAAVGGSVTLVMVFVLQHTQTRQQEALQLWHSRCGTTLTMPDVEEGLL